MNDAPQPQEHPPLKSLTKIQRRVLGVLIEKGFTTPESYPLTIKALTAGCNQKSNRHPLTSYEELDLDEPLNQLRELGLVAVVHTETGRTERFRHWMRRRLTITEPQLAILAELMLRGRQAVGELRARASRMAPIDSLEQLRDELTGLMTLNLVQSDGSLDRRGAEIDHALYEPQERQSMQRSSPMETPVEERSSSAAVVPRQVTAGASAPETERASIPPAGPSDVHSNELQGRLRVIEANCVELRNANLELRQDLASLQDAFDNLRSAFDDLRQKLGE